MYLGIDVGGTNLKAGLVDEEGTIRFSARRALKGTETAEEIAGDLAALAAELLARSGLRTGAIPYVGIGIPGAVSGGNVLYTCNLPLKNVPLETWFRRTVDIPVLLENDANCAAVGEWLCGAGRGVSDLAVVTLGTGVGGGFILNGKLYTGGGMVGEVGHMVICRDGEPCSCGRRGCWEAYASAAALARMARQACEDHPESALCREEHLDARAVFAAAEQGDGTALELCRRYAAYVAAGVTNLINILQPEVLAVGGGVAAADDALLLDPLKKIVAEECYPRHTGKLPRVVRAQLGNDAGIIGAALLRQAI